jgi:hypothetical protein
MQSSCQGTAFNANRFLEAGTVGGRMVPGRACECQSTTHRTSTPDRFLKSSSFEGKPLHDGAEIAEGDDGTQSHFRLMLQGLG